MNLIGEKGELEYDPTKLSCNEVAQRINAMGFPCTVVQDGKQSGLTEVKNNLQYTVIPPIPTPLLTASP